MDRQGREGGCKIGEERCDVCRGIDRKRKWVRVEGEVDEEIESQRVSQEEEMEID